MDLSMTSESIVLPIDGHQLAALCLNPDAAGEPVILRITATTLALTGDRDPIVPPTQAQRIASLVKGAELVVIAGAGHLPFAERASAYHDVLSQFLTRPFVL